MKLTTSERRRGLIALLGIHFLMYCGFFMVIPLVSVYYVERLSFTVATVGLALALRQVMQQGLTLVGGMLADLFGVRVLIGAGVLIRAAGFVSLAWAGTPELLFLSMALSALGGALFDSPSRAAIAALTTEEDRARYFSLVGVASNLGMTIGPLLGALFIRLNFQLVSLMAAACFVLVFFVVLALPPVRVATTTQRAGYGFGLVLRDRTFLIFTALLMGYWYMWVQLTLSMPLAAKRLTGSSDSVALIYTINAGLTVLLQYPVLRAVERHLRAMPIVIIGIATMALGLGAVAIASNLPVLIICVTIFTLGSLLATPTQQSVTAALSDERALGSYFGVNSLALAFGGSLGNFSGGLLTDAAHSMGKPALPWLVFALIGMASAIGLAMLGEQLQYRRATAHLMRKETRETRTENRGAAARERARGRLS